MNTPAPKVVVLSPFIGSTLRVPARKSGDVSGFLLVLMCFAIVFTPHSYADPLGSGFERKSARALLSGANAAIARGNDSSAVQQLHELAAKYPKSKPALEVHYLLGRAYYRIGAYGDSIKEFGLYLEQSPRGKNAEEARSLMHRLTMEYRDRFPTANELDAAIAQLREKLAAEPKSSAHAMDLADKLWMRGRYEEAGKEYLALVARDEPFGLDPVFVRRVELQVDGSHVLLTPEEIMRREVERQPIVLTNLTSFRSNRDRRTQVSKDYVVTGQAINRSNAKISAVQIDVTLYGFGGRVYDTGVYNIGTMYPGSTRAFRVIFTSFREMNSIDRYDYSVRFER